MKPGWRTILIAVCLLAALGAAPAQADQDRGHGPSHHHGHDYGYRGSYGWAYAPFYWGGYRYAPAWYGYAPYSPAYYGPVTGSLGLGYAWGGHHDSYGVSLSLPLYLGPRYSAYPAPAPYRSYRYVEPRPSVPATPAPACRQTREYTTRINIGGQVVPAYGTACLQADGSWKIISGPIIADK